MAFKRFVVIGLMMTSSLSFVEHVCHMDLARLLSMMCCCDEQEGEMNHADMHPSEEMDHSGMHHGEEMDHAGMDHCEKEIQTNHEEDHYKNLSAQGDESRREGVLDACCQSTVQADVTPVLIRTAERASAFLFVPLKVASRVVAHPPVLSNDTPRIVPWRISSPPGYILFRVFLN